MTTILAHIRIHRGAEDRFEAIARQLYRATHDRESGVMDYQYWRGHEPGTYYALLAFTDHRSFIAHQLSPHHDDATPALRGVIAEMRLEWVDPVAGASPWGPTAHQPPAADVGDDVIAATELFAARVADWWAAQRSSG